MIGAGARAVSVPQALGRSLLPLAVAVGAAILIDLVTPEGSYPAKMLFDVGINVILAVSLNMVNGFTGQFSMGHAGFMAIGAYASIVVTYYGGYALFGDVAMHASFGGHGLFFASIVVGGMVAAAAGWLVGLPSLRLRGDYLAIVTLGLGEIIRVLIQASYVQLDADEIAGTAWWKRPLCLGKSLGFIHSGSYNSLAWTWTGVAVTLLTAYRLRESTHGRAFLTVRENEIAAEAIGINTTRYKVSAFVVAAFFAGVAGALFGHQLGAGTALRPEEFNFMKSFEAIIMVVLGGMGSVSGAAIAAVALTLAAEGLRSVQDYRLVAYALLLVLVMILRPQGLFGTNEVWHLIRRWRRRQ